MGLLLLSALSVTSAFVIHAPYYKPCYGSTTNWGYVYWHGSDFGGGAWGGNYSLGVFAAPFLSAQTGAKWGSNYSSIEDQGWAYYGHGPNNKSCFKPTANSSLLRFVFSDFNFTVHLSLACAKTNTSAISASYNVSVGGNLYDYSAGHSLWRTAPSKLIHGGNVTCRLGHGGKFVRTLNLTGPFTLQANATGLVTSDRYWFSVYASIGVEARAPVGNASAGAWFGSLSDRLTAISCPAC